jgi:hypothetical protein
LNKGNKEFKDKIERKKRHDDVINVLRKRLIGMEIMVGGVMILMRWVMRIINIKIP